MRFDNKDSTTEIFLAFGLTPLQIKNNHSKKLHKNYSHQSIKNDPSEFYLSLQQMAEIVVTNANKRRR